MATGSASSGARSAREAVLADLKESMDSFGKAGTGTGLLKQQRGFGYDEPPTTNEEEMRPEDRIPDRPENQAARQFLKNAPSKGLWMPMGTEVKVMQCWRCKAFGHRTGDRECPLAQAGNMQLDAERQAREDPMAAFVGQKLIKEEIKYTRVNELQRLMSEIREEQKSKKKKDKKRKKKEKKKEKKKRKKKRKKRRKEGSKGSSSGSDGSSDGSSDSD